MDGVTTFRSGRVVMNWSATYKITQTADIFRIVWLIANHNFKCLGIESVYQSTESVVSP